MGGRSDSHRTEKDLESDVTVIGGGAAGLAAAVAAAERGSRVVVLEKLGSLGGNAGIYGKEIPAVESPLQKRELHDVTRDTVFRKAMKNSRWDCNARLVRALIDKSGDTIRWLEDKGIEFDMIRIHPDEDLVLFHKVRSSGGELGGALLMNVLSKRCTVLGGRLLCDIEVKRLLTGPKGDITGVLAADKGEEFTVTTRSVVIATGGYSGNQELIAKHPLYHPSFVNAGLPYGGDGIAMATALGADTEGVGALAICGPTPTHATLSLTIAGKTQEVFLMVVAQEPYMVWVNKNGERFVDETIAYNHYAAAIPIARQPDGLSYTLFDSKILQRMSEKGFFIGLAPHIEDWRQQRSGHISGLEAELRRLADLDTIKMSGSWDEIADWIGADPGVLNTTMDEYNRACDGGHDPTFVKEQRHLLPLRTPPYYAIQCQVGILHTMGGIKINEHMQVINKQNAPIQGLYAAGMETGGWEKVHMDWYLGGMTVALSGGRIAGENAAHYSVVK